MALAAAFAALSVAVGASWLIRSAVRATFVERIRTETAMLAGEAAHLTEESAQQFTLRAARDLDLRVTLIAPDGTVIADSARDERAIESMDNHLSRPEIQDSLHRGAGESYRTSDTTHVEYYYSARRVAGDGPARFVRVALASGRVSQVQGSYVLGLSLVVLVSMFLLVGLAYLIVLQLSRPVESVASAIERVADGDLATPIPDSDVEEVARLAAAVRRMRATLLEKGSDLDIERLLLSSVIGGMREGLIVVGHDRRIRLANDEVRRILELPFDPTGHLLAETVRDPTVNSDVERAIEESREIRESVVRLPGDRAFELHVSPLGQAGAEGVLVLLFEITRLETLEGVRRQFVANVSHELRTPLTAIRAFVENLLDGGLDEPENAKRFVEIILKHTDRMGALVADLTDLSLIETGAIRLELRPVEVPDALAEVVEQLQPIASERDVRIEVDVPESLVVMADRRRLEQTLTNLIENAIKFNRPGGYVRISGIAGERPTLVVEDNGIGISRETQKKVFNRFFQIDPARSRASGGTGLGLAIVKHLMRLQGGRVALESELGEGARFTLEFPSPEADG